MSEIAIRVEGLGKRYKIGGIKRPYKTIRESITSSLLAPFRRLGAAGNGATENAFWALKDVGFEVQRGEVVGIIGRNGAGKSTLLKVLSRITDPTEGRAEIVGRVGSLLEVGTGFHPELTGRENVYLNGAILGMTRREITAKFDEIIAFAETEKFLDTPVKYYSSGMYTRLAFAVAAHLEPEILIVDEVLAVGDAQFQKKCLGKMSDVAHQGRTVLFVSHNMSAIQSLCDRCVVMRAGRVGLDADAGAAVREYLQEDAVTSSFSRPAQPDGRPTVVAGRVHSHADLAAPVVRFDFDIATGSACEFSLDLRFLDGTGAAVGLVALGAYDAREMVRLEPGVTRVAVDVSAEMLAVGSYLVTIDLNVPFREYYDSVEACLKFDVTRPPREGRWLVLNQNWMKGSFEIPARLVEMNQIISDNQSI
ncbi:MAG: ABC transporter ATP-binding protein [Tepidisphaeraceae bacterium]|jgi:lipopolysaccharide transport system ATP-binding protein